MDKYPIIGTKSESHDRPNQFILKDSSGKVILEQKLTNWTEVREIERQKIIIFCKDGKVFLKVSSEADKVFLCANRFDLRPGAKYLIGNIEVEGGIDIKNNRILMKQKIVGMSSADDDNAWILRKKKREKTEPKSWELFSSKSLIKKAIFSQLSDSEGYYLPLLLSNEMCLCFGSAFYEVLITDSLG